MPSKEETSDRLHAVLEEVEAEEEAPADEPFPEAEEEVEVEEVTEVEPEEEEAPEAKSSTREYIVFAYKDKAWSEVLRAMSSTAEGAIRTIGQEAIEDGVVYAAVPARNWNEMPPAKKTVTTTISFT